MNVVLLHNTPLKVCDIAIGTCWDKQRDEDVVDVERMYRVGVKFKHASTLEHLVYSFKIEGISRALLQELARHRMASLSVKSTRYTLKELIKEKPFVDVPDLTDIENDLYNKKEELLDRASKYIVLTGNEEIDLYAVLALENLRYHVVSGVSNDIVKYVLPECYKTELVYTINMRSLQNLCSLRTDKSALKEFRELSLRLFNSLPNDHKFLLDSFMKWDMLEKDDYLKNLINR